MGLMRARNCFRIWTRVWSLSVGCGVIRDVRGDVHFFSLAGTVRYRKDSDDNSDASSALKLPPLSR